MLPLTSDTDHARKLHPNILPEFSKATCGHNIDVTPGRNRAHYTNNPGLTLERIPSLLKSPPGLAPCICPCIYTTGTLETWVAWQMLIETGCMQEQLYPYPALSSLVPWAYLPSLSESPFIIFLTIRLYTEWSMCIRDDVVHATESFEPRCHSLNFKLIIYLFSRCSSVQKPQITHFESNHRVWFLQTEVSSYNPEYLSNWKHKVGSHRRPHVLNSYTEYIPRSMLLNLRVLSRTYDNRWHFMLNWVGSFDTSTKRIRSCLRNIL